MTAEVFNITNYWARFADHFDLTSFLLLLCFTYLLYYFTNIKHKPILTCSKYGKLNRLMKTYIKELHKDWFPLIWCPMPLLQTLMFPFLGRSIPFEFEREYVDMEDAGCFAIDWFGFHDDDKHTATDQQKPIVLILPGATGHSEKNYIQEMISVSAEMGYKAVVFNYRGLGKGVMLKNPILSCATKSGDLDKVLGLIAARFPNAPVISIAFSYGSCILMNYLARSGAQVSSNLIGAYILAVPWDPIETKYKMSTFWCNLVVNRHLTSELKGVVRRNLDVFKENEKSLGYNLQHILKSKTWWDFDDRCICPMFGYTDHKEYYIDAALNTLPLENIAIPVLCLNSDDDPITSSKAIPFQEIRRNPLLAVILTKHGGHGVWFEGISLTTKRLPHRIFQQYSELLLKENLV